MKSPQEIAGEIVMKLPDEHRMTSYGMEISIATTSAIQSERDRLTAYRTFITGVLPDLKGLMEEVGNSREDGYPYNTLSHGHDHARQKLIEADAEYFREKV